MDIVRTAGKAKAQHAFGNRARADQHDLFTEAAQRGNLLRPARDGAVIEAAAGSDDLEELRGPGPRGRARRTPWSGFGLAVGSLTLAGLPPTVGFVYEWFLLEALMQQFRVPGLGYRLVLALAGAAVALTFGFAGVTFVRLVGLIVLGWWDNGIRHTTNSKRPITRPEDLRGLKLRTPPDPMTIDIFQTLGAATQQINFNELYVALQQGVTDGQENPLANIHSSKLYDVNRFISLTGHQWQCNPFLASRIAWGRLRPEDRRLVQEVAKEAEAHQRTVSGEIDARLLGDFRASLAVPVNDVDQAPFRAATRPVLDRWEQRPFGDFVKRLRAGTSA